MPSTFFGLNVAASGLQAQQTALDVVAHNIANASNPNYKRQEAVTQAAPSFPYGGGAGPGQLGGGVQVTTIRRMQDDYIGTQILDANQSLGRWQAGQQALDQVVSVIGEPSDHGLSTGLDKFWNAWHDLSANPQDPAARTDIIQYGSTVATTLNSLYSQISAVGAQEDKAIPLQVDQINHLATQLADLNGEIQQVRGTGQQPNDLLDQRDALLGQLSQLADIQVRGDGGSGDVVAIGGRALVQGDRAAALAAGTDDSGHATVTWADDSSPADIRGGALGGMLEVSHTLVPGYLASLDKVAQGLITGVNALHAAGSGLDGATGRDFFSGTGARDIAVDPALIQDPQKVAASTSGAPGDGNTALAIAGLKSKATVDGATINDAYTALVSKNGADAAHYKDGVDSQTLIQQQLTQQQQSLSGVSLDQEMTDMIRFQEAYSASARVVTTMNDMLGTLIKMVGSG